MEDEALEFYDPWTCAKCGGKTRHDRVNLAIWSAAGLVAIEDVPAYVCDKCEEQSYDDDVASEMRQLAGSGFPKDRAVREVTVPVFKLAKSGNGQS